MTWAQTFTIIISLGGIGISMLAGLWRVYSSTISGIREDVSIAKQDIQLTKVEMREHAKKYEADTARRDARWENLLQKIYNLEKKSYLLEHEYSPRKKKKNRRSLSTESI